jgi:hypothetical protein
LSGSSGDSGCSSCEDGGKLVVCAAIDSGCTVREGLCLHAPAFCLFLFGRELRGWVCVDFWNCAPVLIRGWSCQCHTILALISLPLSLI